MPKSHSNIDFTLRNLIKSIQQYPSESTFSELLSYVKQNIQVPSGKKQEDYAISIAYSPSIQKRMLSEADADMLFRILLAHAGSDDPKTFQLTPDAFACLELFYYLTVYDENFQDVIEERDYKDLQHLSLDRHVLQGNDHQQQVAVKLIYFISKNIKRLRNWRRFVKPSAHAKVQALLDALTSEEVEELERPRPERLPPQGLYSDVSADDVCEIFDTDPIHGLTEQEVERRRFRYGKNTLPKPKKPSWIKMLFTQLLDFMVMILVITSIVAACIQDYKSSVVLAIVVVFNVLVGFIEEVKAERELSALLSLNVENATVVREGKIDVIEATELVPGDIVILEEGTRVPADCRIIEESDLTIVEAYLTGESVPTEKTTTIIYKKNIPLPEHRNIAFMSTLVANGHGKGVVVAIGKATEIGKVSKSVQVIGRKKTPLQKRLAKLGFVLVALSFVLCGIVIIIGIIRGHEWVNMIKVGISLAVSAIPEGLVAVTTVTMALGVSRMKKQNAIVRTLAAVETLGSVTVICTDKTGTLTEGKMVVQEIFTLQNTYHFQGDVKNLDQKIIMGDQELDKKNLPPELMQIFMVFALCNNATIQPRDEEEERFQKASKLEREYELMGDPTEIALLLCVFQAGLCKSHWTDRLHFIMKDELAFASDRKRMSVVYEAPLKMIPFLQHLVQFSQQNSNLITVTKGAVESVLQVCTHIQDGESIETFTDEMKKSIEDRALEMAERGMRVLGLAYKINPPSEKIDSIQEVENNLVFLGCVGILDPPRVNVADSILECTEAGIRVIVITGDHPSTAKYIAEAVGIIPHDSDSYVMQGKDFDELVAAQRLNELHPIPQVFARVSPDTKYEIVKFLQKSEVVAMIGDGVNDASSLKKADVGVAMGVTGTDIAKQAANIVLADDNFATIVTAIKEGRRTYDNIVKFIIYLLSCNFSEIITVFVAVSAGLPIPFTAIQILWNNLVADVPPSLSLGADPPGHDVMKRLPRNPRSGVFSWRGWLLLLYQAMVMSGIALGAFAIVLYVYHYEIPHAQSLTLVLLISIQLAHGLHSRSLVHSILQINPFSNLWMIASIIFSFSLTVMALYVDGFNRIIELVPLSLNDWGIIGIGLAAHAVLIECMKIILRIRRRYAERKGYKFFTDV